MNFLSFSFEKINLIYLGKIKKWYILIQVCSNFSMNFWRFLPPGSGTAWRMRIQNQGVPHNTDPDQYHCTVAIYGFYVQKYFRQRFWEWVILNKNKILLAGLLKLKWRNGKKITLLKSQERLWGAGNTASPLRRLRSNQLQLPWVFSSCCRRPSWALVVLLCGSLLAGRGCWSLLGVLPPFKA